MNKLVHRGGLAAKVKHIWPEPSLFDRIGGRPTVEVIVDGLYDRIEANAELRPMFNATLHEERQRQKLFFEEWLGGEVRYPHYRGTRLRHQRFMITRKAAGQWLRHFRDAMKDAGVVNDLIDEVLATLKPLALSLVNHQGPIPAASRMRHPCVDRWRDAAKLAAQGDLERLKEWVRDDPEIIEAGKGDSQRLLFEAARKGHLPIVEFLVDAGVDVNAPDYWHTEMMVTPWCIARLRKHQQIADYLEAHGAVIDVFSAAYLGDTELLTTLLCADPDLVNGQDPANDHKAVTPIFHAVWAGHYEAGKLLLDRGATLAARGGELISKTVGDKRIDLVHLLLEHGATARHLGPGPWVLNESLAKLLKAHGADVNEPPGDWLEFCTAHHGQRDEPRLIEALLRHGADLKATDRGATALHKAAKAGHLGVLKVLLENGADVDAQDPEGETSLFYIFRSGSRADRVQAASILLDHGADPLHPNSQGKTPLDHTAKGRQKDTEALRTLMQQAAARGGG